jgi:cytochrome c-type biogenesis protein CcmF
VTTFGQLCLLAALVASGYAAFACFLAWRREHRLLERLGTGAAVAGVLAMTVVGAILAVALLGNDFRLACVAQYSSRLLPWQYALSAFWVGQAGSLLLWAWSVGVLAIVYRFLPRRGASPLRQPAFAVLMAYQFFLVAIMVFGANPMEPSLAATRDGAGLGPSLQHPAMLLHPPVVFLGYAGCSIPFALAVAALLAGRLDAAWVRDARPWAFFSWAVLGIGILVGAYWAYEELGWGGYWNWDPVENGSLIPWLAATAMIHAAIVCRQRGALKRTTLVLAVATFAACNFAAFLTRSGVFGSLHAFSQSPIGWMFLAIFFLLATGTGALMIRRRAATAPETALSGLWAKETVAVASVLALVLLATAVFIGTATPPISQVFFPHKVLLGAGFYNAVLAPTALLLLAAMAAAPLLRWGAPPDARQLRALGIAAVAGLAAVGWAWLGGLRHPLAFAVAGLAAATATAVAASWILDARRPSEGARWPGLLPALRNRRRTYAGYGMHVALACLALGVAGSSLGTQQHEATLSNGESAHWTGRDVRFVRLLQQRLADKLVVQAELEVTADGAVPYTLLPAQEFYFLQNQWNPKVAVHSTWGGDFYAILHGGEGQERIQLTVVENPLMRWMWLAGWIVLAGAVPWFWPAPKNAARTMAEPTIQRDAETRRRTAA